MLTSADHPARPSPNSSDSSSKSALRSDLPLARGDRVSLQKALALGTAYWWALRPETAMGSDQIHSCDVLALKTTAHIRPSVDHEKNQVLDLLHSGQSEKARFYGHGLRQAGHGNLGTPRFAPGGPPRHRHNMLIDGAVHLIEAIVKGCHPHLVGFNRGGCPRRTVGTRIVEVARKGGSQPVHGPDVELVGPGGNPCMAGTGQ